MSGGHPTHGYERVGVHRFGASQVVECAMQQTSLEPVLRENDEVLGYANRAL